MDLSLCMKQGRATRATRPGFSDTARDARDPLSRDAFAPLLIANSSSGERMSWFRPYEREVQDAEHVERGHRVAPPSIHRILQLVVDA